MNTISPKLLFVAAAVLTMVVSGCSDDKLPAVNDENCKPEAIAKIERKDLREKFSAQCLRRGPSFKPSEPKKW